ncbi:hypothetical protein BpHYR1_008678 [Brachionus plicatilis]|uniref:Uncharacterized protein n=1 Tax=Brachionus plicatilis TaxID=10195 RepID=A0A3M7QH10_BRAPC|nr:hypothetical protein BpHYR1_008678 [Brachionus plicatilis]
MGFRYLYIIKNTKKKFKSFAQIDELTFSLSICVQKTNSISSLFFYQTRKIFISINSKKNIMISEIKKFQ